MSKKLLLSSLISVSFVTVSAQAKISAQRHARGEKAKGEIILKIKTDATPEQLAELQRLEDDLQITEKKIGGGEYLRLSIGRTQVHGHEDDIASEFERTGAVESATANSVVEPLLLPNDPLSGPGDQWQWPAIHAAAAWDVRTSTTNILIAVCDAGFDLTHPDLAAQFVLPGYNTVTNNSTLVRTTEMHGTIVSGTMAAASNNGQGVAGMIWSAKVLPIQISNAADGAATRADIAECIRYAADRGAKVVNVSYSGMWNDPAFGSDYPQIEDAAAYLVSKGGLVVAAAGNDGRSTGTAANSPNILLVGATEQHNLIADFSDRGPAVDVVAPGNYIYTTCPTYSWESYGDQVADYAVFNGTSVASPIVAGLAGLIYAQNPAFTAAQVQSIIFTTAMDLGDAGVDGTYSKGLINAGAALAKAKVTSADTVAPTISITSPAVNSTVAGSFTAYVNAADNVKVAKVEFWIDSSLVAVSTAAPFGMTLDSKKFTDGVHHLRARAIDSSNNASTYADVPINVKNAISILMDNLAPGASDASHAISGTWCTSGVSGYYGVAGLYSCGSGIDTYRMIPNIATAGSYKVYVRYQAYSNRSAAVTVNVFHAAGITKVPVNMQTNGGTFVLLGTFNLTAGPGNYVEVNDANGMAAIDAVRFDKN